MLSTLFLRFYQRFRAFRHSRGLLQRHRLAIANAGTAALLCRAWSVPTTAHCANSDQVQDLDPATLSHEFLIKQASIAAVEATSRILMQLTAAVLDAHEAYCKSLNRMCSLMKTFETELGRCAGSDELWLELIAMREEANRLKANLVNLESRMQSVSNLVEAMAQTAFVNGAEYAGISANERLLSAQREIRSAAKRTASLEAVLNEAQKASIIAALDNDDYDDLDDRKKPH